MFFSFLVVAQKIIYLFNYINFFNHDILNNYR